MKADNLDCVYLQSCNTAFLPVLYAKHILKIPVFYNEQDLFPDNALLSGSLSSSSVIYRIAKALQKYAYRNASCLSTISPDMRKRMAENYGIDPNRIHVIGNWGHEEQYQDPSGNNAFLEAHPKKSGEFRAVYAGNVSKMQNVELIVQTAALMQNDAVSFCIVGDGANKPNLERLAAEQDLRNVSFLPMQPEETVSDLYASADVNLIPLKPGIIQTALPSKLADCLLADRPIITCFDADALFCAEAAQYGIPNAPPDDPEALRQLILTIRKNGYHGKNRDFLQTFYCCEENAGRYCELICSMKKIE